MQQVVEVAKLLDHDLAEVIFERESACSGDCSHCGGCNTARQRMVVTAKNVIDAQPGDHVILEASSGFVLSAALLVYLAPLAAFFIGYFLGYGIGASAGLFGAAGFLIGLIPMLLRNWRLKKTGRITFEITGYAQDSRCLDI